MFQFFIAFEFFFTNLCFGGNLAFQNFTQKSFITLTAEKKTLFKIGENEEHGFEVRPKHLLPSLKLDLMSSQNLKNCCFVVGTVAHDHKVLGSIPAIFSRVQSGHSKKDLNKGTSKLYLVGCCRWAFKIHFELICANLICLPDSAESWGDRERKKCPLPGGIWTRNFVITNKAWVWELAINLCVKTKSSF